MQNDYLNGLKSELRRKALNRAVKLENQAVDSLETEPDSDRVLENAKKFADFLEKGDKEK